MAVVEALDEWWGRYEREYQHRSWRDYRHLLAELIGHSPGTPIVDVGCGFGFLVECARQFGIPAVGLEAADAAIAESRRRHPQADIRQWSAGERLPFADGTIAAAMLNQIVDHFTLDENRSVFGELHRVLCRNGILVVHSPSKHNRIEQRRDTGHITFFSPSEFRAFVTAFGFRIVDQPYHARHVFDHRIGRLLVRVVARAFRPERLAATIDLIAAKTHGDGQR
jgi:ubiquinone/menaquinone biosynthesis C-methylase UbiE